jgi:glycosyltransferase involved in cell wall biosynthesis
MPVFEALAHRPGIELKLLYGELPAGPPNVAPGTFHAEYVPLNAWRLLGQTVFWHSAQIAAAARAATDVLVLSWNIRYASLVPALLRARREGLATVLWGHGYSKHEAWWRSWPRRKVAELATALLFYNETTARHFVEAGWDANRVHVALNALDQRPIQQARQYWLDRPQELERFRHQQGLTEGPVILFVSRLEPENRVDLLVAAGSHLLPKYPKLKIVIVGKGRSGDAIRDLANGLSLREHTRFLGAIYEEQVLAPWFLCSDVFCYPANIGLSLLHAFGYGLPVVTSSHRAAQNPEIEALVPGVNGETFSQNDPHSLANAIDRVLNNPERRRSLSEQAQRTVIERFTLDNMVDGMERAIRFAASHRRVS